MTAALRSEEVQHVLADAGNPGTDSANEERICALLPSKIVQKNPRDAEAGAVATLASC